MKKLIVSMLMLCVISLTGCVSGVRKYDLLIDKDENCNQKWSDIDAQLQRRSDLIPNLVAVVKGSAAHEEKVLREVVEARASATQIKLTADDLSNPEKMKAFEEAQSKLKGSLSRLMMTTEAYPDLKANQGFHDLQIQIEGSENRILRARTEYNKSVKEFNTELRHVSGAALQVVIGDKTFKQRVYYQAEASAKDAPKVVF